MVFTDFTSYVAHAPSLYSTDRLNNNSRMRVAWAGDIATLRAYLNSISSSAFFAYVFVPNGLCCL